MRKSSNWKKILLFGLLGALGCLIGWLFGELFLAWAMPPQTAEEAATPTIIFNPELTRRLEREGAKTGDVQLSLLWNNYNDLDLHCIDPNGEEIYYSHKRSRSRGELDVDMNAGLRRSREPVENIYWPEGGAPSGKYRVFVNHFSNHGDPDPTSYTVGVLVEGSSQEFTGSITHGDSKRLIYEFEIEPKSEQQSPEPEFWKTVLIIGLWTSLLAIGLSLALVMGQNRYFDRPLLSFSQGMPVIGGGLAAGLVAGGTAQALLSLISQFALLAKIGWIFGWVLLGGILGRGMGLFIPNLETKKAQIAGAIGGFFGALAFLGVSQVAGDLVGRLVGAAILGFAIGLMVILIEVTFRKAWVEIRYGPKELRTANLGPEPVTIGSAAEVCTIRVYGAPDVALRLRSEQGQIFCEDVPNRTTRQVQPGYLKSLGNAEVWICTDNSLPQTQVSSRPTVTPASSQFTLNLGSKVITLNNDTCIREGEIPGLVSRYANGIVAQINPNPKDLRILGLKNLSNQAWIVTMKNGERKTIESDRTIKLAQGTRINFGSIKGKIE